MDAVIIGANGFGREIVQVLDAAVGAAQHGFDGTILGFLDDGSPDLDRLDSIGLPMLGTVDHLTRQDAGYLIGVGNPRVRRALHERAHAMNALPFPAVAHRTAAIGRDVRMADGSVVCAQSVITTNVRIGAHFHLNLCSTIGHDCCIGDFVTVAPGVNISGNVTVGDEVEFGTGAKILPGISIGAGAMIGAGAVVTKDVPAGATVVGVPARPIGSCGG